MSDRPTYEDADVDVETPTPVRSLGSMRVTKEQLAAAERTRDYHLRRLQAMIAQGQRGSEVAARREH
jgi:hypothetical protein